MAVYFRQPLRRGPEATGTQAHAYTGGQISSCSLGAVKQTKHTWSGVGKRTIVALAGAATLVHQDASQVICHAAWGRCCLWLQEWEHVHLQGKGELV